MKRTTNHAAFFIACSYTYTRTHCTPTTYTLTHCLPLHILPRTVLPLPILPPTASGLMRLVLVVHNCGAVLHIVFVLNHCRPIYRIYSIAAVVFSCKSFALELQHYVKCRSIDIVGLLTKCATNRALVLIVEERYYIGSAIW